jgi:D-amino-acid dehydrogenase
VPWLARFTAAALRPGEAQAGTALVRELARQSVALHRSWADELDTGLVQAGTLNVYLSEHGLREREATVAEHRAAGLDVELLDAGEVRDRAPGVLGAVGAAFYPGDAHLDSLELTRALAKHATRLGATVLENVEVLRVERAHQDLWIETTDGTLTAQRCVVAGGVWSRRLGADLGLSLPLEGAKGYHVEYRDIEHAIEQPTYLAETRVVATPLAGRLRLAGTLELGTDPDAVGARRVDAVVEAGAKHVAGVADARVSHIWRGLRPMAPDGMPMIGQAGHDHRVLVATGHGMLGITLAPVTAELIATLVAGGDPDPAHAAIRPDRFRRIPVPF